MSQEQITLSVEKENMRHVPVVPAKESQHEMSQNLTLPRTPLSNINGQLKLSRSAKTARRARYSFVSPASSPCPPGSKPRHRVRSAGCATVSADTEQAQAKIPDTSSKQVPLNALVYKQVIRIVEDLKQEHESQLKDKDSYIDKLEKQLRIFHNENQSVLEGSPEELDRSLETYVDHIIQKAVAHLEKEQRDSNTDQATSVLFETRSTASSPIHFEPSPCPTCISHSSPDSNSSCSTGDVLVTPLRFNYVEGTTLACTDSKQLLEQSGSPPVMDFASLENISPVTGLEDNFSHQDSIRAHLKPSGTSTLVGGRGSFGNAISQGHGETQTDVRTEFCAVSSTETVTSPHSTHGRIPVCKDSTTMTSPKHQSVERSTASNQTTPIQHVGVTTQHTVSRSIATSPISVVSTGTITTETMMTPVRHRSIKIMTECIESESISTSPIVILGSRNEHQQEILKVEQQKEEYKAHYYTSQQKIRELQMKLDVYSQLRDIFPKVKQSQMEVQTMLMIGFQKMSKLVQEHKDRKSQLHTEYDTLLKERQDKLEHVQSELQGAQASKTELEKKVTEQEDEILSKENELSTLSQRLIDSESSSSDMSLVLDSTKEMLEQKSVEAAKLKATVQDQEKELSKLKENQERLELEKLNLHRTLESREKDMDNITQERDQLSKFSNCQKAIIESLKKDLLNFKTVKEDLEEMREQVKTMTTASRDHQDFLDLEKAALGEELEEKESSLSGCRHTLVVVSEENKTLRAECVRLRESCLEIAKELDEIKVRAHLMLYEQNSEISKSAAALDGLMNGLKTLQDEVRCGLECQAKYTQDKQVPLPPKCNLTDKDKKCKKSHRKSFVCSVLDVMKESSGKSDNLDNLPENNEAENDVPAQPLPMIGASGSAFSRVASSSESPQGAGETTDSRSVVEHGTNSPKSDSSPSADIAKNTDSEQEVPLYKQVEGISASVSTVLEEFRKLQKELMDRIASKDQQLRQMKDQTDLEKDRNIHDQKSLKSLIDSLKKEISQCCTRENHIHEELTKARNQVDVTTAELTDAQDLITKRVDQCDAMNEEIRAVKESKRDLEKLCQDKDAELTALKKVLDENLGGVMSNYGQAAADGIQELVNLKKKNVILLEQIFELSDEKEEVLQKCARRMEVYKSNWNKAEIEVNRLDDLVEKLRKALSYHVMVISGCSQLQPLLNELGISTTVTESASKA